MAFSGNDRTGNDAERSPEEIERAIAGTRAAIESTVEELGERLRPGQMAEDARHYVREKAVDGASEAWRSVRDTVRANPIQTACIVGGLAALLAVRQTADSGPAWRQLRRGSRRWRQRDSFLDAPRPATLASFLTSAGGRASEAGVLATERALALGQRLRRSDATARAQHQMERARSEIEALAEEQPVLAGIASFALGAILGGALGPRRSRRETGERSDETYA